LLVSTTSGSDDLPTLLLLSSGSMLANGFFLDLELAEKHITLVVLDVHLLFHVIVIVGKVAHSPVRGVVVITFLLVSAATKLLVVIRVLLLVATLHFLVLGRRDQTCAKRIRLRLDLLLSFGCLFFSKFFVHVLIDFFWTSVGGGGSLSHLLSHHLGESTVSTKFHHSLGLLLLITLLFLFLSQLVDIGFRQCTCFMRLPLDVIELLEGFLLHKNL